MLVFFLGFRSWIANTRQTSDASSKVAAGMLARQGSDPGCKRG